MAQSIRDWPNYVRQMYKHTAPGGYVEIVELFGDNFCDDGTLKPNGGLRTYYKHWIPAMEKSLNFKQPTDADYAQFLKDAGFVDVKVYHRKQILSPWPKDKTLKEMGRYNLLNVQTGYHAYGMALFTRVCGFTTEEATKLCNDARDDASSTKTHVYNKMQFPRLRISRVPALTHFTGGSSWPGSQPSNKREENVYITNERKHFISHSPTLP